MTSIYFEESSQSVKDWMKYLLISCQQCLNIEENKYCREKMNNILFLSFSLKKELKIWKKNCCLLTVTEVILYSN